MKYDNDRLATLCSSFDFLDYVSQTHEIKTIGGRHYTLCPFHQEKTPSLLIDEHNRYKCFGCGCKGGPIDWIQQTEQLSFDDAVEKLTRLTGSSIAELKQCDALKFYKEVRNICYSQHNEEPVRKILPMEKINDFADELPEEWLEEGIKPEVMKKFNIRIDKKSNRIVYPVYDASGDLIGFKGRTRFKDFKNLGVAKYMNYQSVGNVNYFGGMKEHFYCIKSQRTAIVFEGIKSVMKLDGFGNCTGISAETHFLSEGQIIELIKLRVKELTIAFDSDVPLHEITEKVAKLKHFMKVFVIVDNKHLLGEKESPVDRGKEIWDTLYSNRIQI